MTNGIQNGIPSFFTLHRSLSSCHQVLAEHILYIHTCLCPLELPFYFNNITTDVTTFTVLTNHFYSLTSMILICDIIVITVLKYVG
jgi:hypothetical protein